MFDGIFGLFGHNKSQDRFENGGMNYDEEVFRNFINQSDDIFKNFENMMDGFGFQNGNQADMPIFSFLGFSDDKQNFSENYGNYGSINKETDPSLKYSLRDSLLKKPQEKLQGLEIKQDIQELIPSSQERPQLFSSYQFSNIFGAFDGNNGVFEKRIRTKGPDGQEKTVVTRHVGDHIEETVTIKGPDGRIISQESNVTKDEGGLAQPILPAHGYDVTPKRDVETTLDNIRKEYSSPDSSTNHGMFSSILASLLGPGPTDTKFTPTSNRDHDKHVIEAPAPIKSMLERPKDKKALSLYEKFFGPSL